MPELVKIKSNNPAHPKGYYIQFADKVRPGDEIYTGEEIKEEPAPAEPVKTKRKSKKEV